MSKSSIYGSQIGNNKKNSKSHKINHIAGHLLFLISLVVIFSFVLIGKANGSSGTTNYLITRISPAHAVLPVEAMSLGGSAQIVNPKTIYLPIVFVQKDNADGDWPMVAANLERTSWTSAEVTQNLQVEWYRPIQAYIPQQVQLIAANGLIYVSTANGLYALKADTGETAWRFDTAMPLGHSPSVDTRTNTVYVGGFDRKLYALNAVNGGFLWSYDGAAAGYDTNPLIVQEKVILGNRDGALYAIGAQGSSQPGELIWKYQSGGPINFSPAYKNGVVYFASDDNYAYAVNVNDGTLVWKSNKMSGDGFQSYWPVIYTDPTTLQDYVIFAAGNGYRAFSSPGSLSLSCGGYEWCEWFDEFNGNVSGTLGPIVSINEPWAQGKTVVDYSQLAEYFENNPNPDPHFHKPYRRFYYIYQTQPGPDQTAVEYSMDVDKDGYPEYAPIDPFLSNSGDPYPPLVGSDGLLYMGNHYYSDGQSLLMGWRFGTQYFALTSIQGAGDEPNAFSSGGNILYRSICCDRVGDWVSTNGGGGVLWVYDLSEKAPNYDEMWWFSDPDYLARLTGNYGDVNGIYHSHGDQNPLIPYNGMIFIHRSNAIIAFGSGLQRGKLPTLTINQSDQLPNPLSTSELIGRLENEIQKILAAGHLRPGYYNAGQFNSTYPELNDYFSNPGETLYTLSDAYPYVSVSLQNQLKSYLMQEYDAYFKNNLVSKIGWSTGGAREWMPLPPEVGADLGNFGDVLFADYNAWGWTYPQYNFYALWKYISLVVPEETQTAYTLAKSKLEVPAGGSELYSDKPWIINGYIAGYIGFLKLQEAAGKIQDDYQLYLEVTDELSRLEQLRADSFSIDTPYQSTDYYQRRTVNISRNFIMLVPELGDYLGNSIPTTVVNAINEYQGVGPYWFVSRYSASIGESTMQNLYDYPAIFQAKAYILNENRDELSRYLDVGAFAQGDLFYIQNLIAAIKAP
jgi:outer membrane protein assembly factor BamB